MRFFARSKAKNGRLGVEVTPFGASVAWLAGPEGSADGRGRCECAAFEGTDLVVLAASVREWATGIGGEGAPCAVVLHPSFYHIYFVERPEGVGDDDLNEAVKWKIRDLLDEAIENVIVDSFPIPEDAFHGRSKMLYVIAARRGLIEEIATAFEEAGLDLVSLGVTELAAERMLQLLGDEEKAGVALLRMRNSEGMINLSHGGNLYVTRHIDTSLTNLATASEDERFDVLDELLLEVQRSLDYFDTQIGKGQIRRFWLAPMRMGLENVQEHLSSNLGVPIHQMDLDELFENEAGIPRELQARCFAAVGAACVPIAAGSAS